MYADIIREKLQLADIPRDVMDVAELELQRLDKVPPGSSDFAIISTYLDWVATLPWAQTSEVEPDLLYLRQALDASLLGLAHAKEQIIDAVAGGNHTAGLSLSVCLTGPKGMGIRALCRTIADALERSFVRISIGELRGESDLIGETRDTASSRPGYVIRSIRDSGHNDPVFLIEDIDHLQIHSDQELRSIVLELLHPERRSRFFDRYLSIPFDLSQAIVLTTASAPHLIPEAFHDFLELIRLPGYTNREKREISKRFIIPKRVASSGLTEDTATFSDDAIDRMIENYTHEAGVHQLDRQIVTLVRGLRKEKLETGRIRPSIGPNDVADILGPPQIVPEMMTRMPEVGITTALVWSESGGSVAFIEASRMAGRGDVKITGNSVPTIGELVAKSLSYIKSHADQLDIPMERISNSDIHLHFPHEIMVPDCASLGLPVIIDLVSLFTEMPVHHDFAFTGETTLRGKVYPVDGVEEKMFAAHRSSIRKVFLPALNEREIISLPDEIREDIEFEFVNHVDEAVETAIMKIILPNQNLDTTIENVSNSVSRDKSDT
jgi:ATP-dependent Lon protease